MTAVAATPSTRVLPRSWADLAVLTVLSLIGILGFEASFGGLGFLAAALGGLAIGIAVGIGSKVLRLGALATVLGGILAYFLFGTVLAVPSLGILGFIPTFQSLADLATGAVNGWADILTLQTPIGAPIYIVVVPYVCGWLVGLVSAVLALRWMPSRGYTSWRYFVALIGPVLLYVVGILTGTQHPYLAGVRGVGFAVIALVWMGWRHVSVQQVDRVAARDIRRSKLIGVTILVVIAAVVGGGVGSLVAPSAFHRFVLRDEITPPFDPLALPSPLAGFRAYKTGTLKNSKLFTISGLKKGDTIRLATMDAYNGKLWNVVSTDASSDGSGTFSLIGRDVTQPTLLTPGGTRDITVTLGTYSDVWLPTVGYPTEIDLLGKTADRKDDLRYNSVTGTTVLATQTATSTTGTESGDSYTMHTVLQKVPSNTGLTNAAPAIGVVTPVQGPLNALAAKAAVLSDGAKTNYQKLEKIEAAMQAGYLSDGAPGAPSLAGHGSDRMLTFVKQASMVGDAEQYASAFAIMANDEGFPSRVVIGFTPKIVAGQKAVTVTGADVTAWPEVAIEGLGWVAFNPTGTNTGIPPAEPPVTKSQQVQQQRQPPRASQPQNNVLSPTDVKKANPHSTGFSLPAWAWVIIGVIGIPAALYFVPLVVVGLLKRRRRERRRTTGSGDTRAAGAWSELLDSAAELGFRVPRGRTRLQAARSIGSQVDDPAATTRLVELSSAVDAEVFGGQEVSNDSVDKVWSSSLGEISVLTSMVPTWRLRLSRFRVRSKHGLPASLTLPALPSLPAAMKGLRS